MSGNASLRKKTEDEFEQVEKKNRQKHRALKAIVKEEDDVKAVALLDAFIGAQWPGLSKDEKVNMLGLAEYFIGYTDILERRLPEKLTEMLSSNAMLSVDKPEPEEDKPFYQTLTRRR